MVFEIVSSIKLIESKVKVIFLKNLKKYNLTEQQGKILSYITDNKNINHRDIEVKFKISAATVSGIISRLHQNDYIKKKEDVTDRRYIYLEPTEKALKIKEDITCTIKETDSIIGRDFSDDELNMLLIYLKRIIFNLESENK